MNPQRRSNQAKKPGSQNKPKSKPSSPTHTPQSDLSDLVMRAQMDANLLSSQEVMQLQRTIGNQAVLRLLHRTPEQPAKTIQRTPINDGDILEADKNATAWLESHDRPIETDDLKRHDYRILMDLIKGGNLQLDPKKKGEVLRSYSDNNKGINAFTKEESAASNPDFESAAIEFEARLGNYAFNHPKATAAAQLMADKIMAYMESLETLYGEFEDKQKEIDALWSQIGDDKPAHAGAIGKEVEQVQAVLAEGNLREQMTHIYNFSKLLSKDVMTKKKDELEQLIKDADMNKNALMQRRDEMLQARQAGGRPRLIDYNNEADQHFGNALKHKKDNVRERRNLDDKTGVKAKDVELSEYEQNFMGKGEPDDVLTWELGIKEWQANETNFWVRMNRNLSIPVAAGPSGHTFAFMKLAHYFGMPDMTGVRLAVMGYLLPIQAHSLVEIMDVASVFDDSLKFTKGQMMYTNIPPLTRKELLDNVTQGGKFPHELAPAKTPTPSN